MKRPKPLLLIGILILCACNTTQESEDDKKQGPATTTPDSQSVRHEVKAEKITDTQSISSEATDYAKRSIDQTPTLQAQKFIFQADSFKSIECAKGTILEIEPNSFVFRETGNSVQGDIKLFVREFYKRSEMVLAKLTTTSNDRLLETGGMLHISAYSQGKSLDLQAGKAMQIRFNSSNSMKEGMQLFNGERNRDSIVNWTRQNTSTRNPSTFQSLSPSQLRFIYADSVLQKLNSDIQEQQMQFEIEQSSLLKFSYTLSPEGEAKNVRLIEGDIGKTIKKQVLKALNKEISGVTLPSSLPMDSAWVFFIGTLKNNRLRLTPVANNIRSFNYSPNSYRQSAKEDTVLETMFDVTRLGWINCDRFIDDRRNRYDLVVTLPREFKGEVLLVFNDINSIMPAQRLNLEKMGFRRIPVGEQITVIGYEKGNDAISCTYKKLDGYTDETSISLPEPMSKEKFERIFETTTDT